jgi:hypothetical protein
VVRVGRDVDVRGSPPGENYYYFYFPVLASDIVISVYFSKLPTSATATATATTTTTTTTVAVSFQTYVFPSTRFHSCLM